MGNADSFLKTSQSIGLRPTSSIESGLFSAAPKDTICSFFCPMHYESGYAYPLVVWLHGDSDDERHLMRVMPQVSMRNYVAVAPRGICLSKQTGNSGTRECYGWSQSEPVVQQAEQRVFDCIEMAADRYCIRRDRIFLAGFDSGGTMAFRIAMSHPTHFAGVLSFGGAFPDERTPLSNLNAARRLPLFLAAGRDSLHYPPEQVCENLRLFHTAGLLITLRQYPCGHELSLPMLSDMDRWIMEQIVPGETSREPSEMFDLE